MACLLILRTVLKTTIHRALAHISCRNQCFKYNVSVTLSNNLWGGHCCNPHCLEGEGETEGQGGQQRVAELGITGSDNGVWQSPMKMPQMARVRREHKAGQAADVRRELEVGQEVPGLGLH